MKNKIFGQAIFGRTGKQTKIDIPREITENGLQIWTSLPERVKQDPTLALYQSEYERSRKNLNSMSNKSDNKNSLSENRKTRFTTTVILDRIEVVPDENNLAESNDDPKLKHHRKKWLNYFKIGILLLVWSLFTGLLMITDEKELSSIPMSIAVNKTRIYEMHKEFTSHYFEMILTGAFGSEMHNTTEEMIVNIQVQFENSSDWMTIDEWILPIANPESGGLATTVTMAHLFDITKNPTIQSQTEFRPIQIAMKANLNIDFPFQLTYDWSPINKDIGIIYATLILAALYVFIIWEIIDKVQATIIASTLAISTLAALGSRPTLVKVVSWIDMETLFLLFGMMIIVGILSETGLFDYMAVFAYKITKGNAWPLIYCLCLFTAILSALLDNVTTLLLMGPVSIRLCEIMGLHPIPVLISMILYSNIGGALTPVGDPPNIILISNSYITKNGVTFANFILHMAPGVILACIQTFLQLRLNYRTINDLRAIEPKSISQLREEIDIWQEAVESLSLHSNDDDFIRWTLVEKVKNLKKTLKEQLKSGTINPESFMSTLRELEVKYPIKNKSLLVKSLLAATFTLGFFFLHSIPGLDRLSLGWISFLGAILLLILADRNNMDAALSKVEWSTLIFFASLFVLIEALSELGLINWIGNQTKNIILSVDENWRLAVAILIILWVSAITSSFLDNIPITTMMVKIVVSLAQNRALGLPIAPLVWALSFGACFGGNGTLIGASANIICASVAEQHGFKMSFYQYCRIGFPVMICNLLMATFYMMIAHVLLHWH